MTAPSLDAIFAITPELCLILLAVIVLLYDRALKPSEHRNPALITAWGTLVIIIITLGIWLIYDQPSNTPTQYWGGMISQDMYTMIFRLVFLLALLLTALISIDVGKLQRGEYFALLISATIGFSLMAASTDLMMLYVALETAGISLYVLAGFTKGVYRSSEAGMKYFIYGAFATAVMLYGMSLLFGMTGETNIYEVSRVIFQGIQELDAAVLLASAMVVVGFGFKISAVPFHFWAPDVYEGAPSPVTGLISTASKAAGFAIFLRVATAGIFGPPESSNDWWAMLVAMCIVTMTLGNLLAIRQTNIKRMLAYSSIAQAGYGMIGLITAVTTAGATEGSVDGVSATMYFLIYYVFTNIAAFGVIIVFSNLTGSDEISDLAGLSRRSPWLALAMMLALLSLGGIPPTAGFFGKFFIFRAAVEAGLWWLALIGILNAFIGLYYYLSVVKVMYLYRSEDESISIPLSRAAALAIGITVFGILYLGLFADRTFEWTREAALSLFPFLG
ncbi:MAG: NADH-quinone oxidoreductase subunit N [Candidatus Promineifilaceae bacterium]